MCEVQTPLLSQFSGIEPCIDPLVVSGQNSEFQNNYLVTSPEFNLKKMLVFCYPNERGIFEIAHAFRDDRKSQLHDIEFTMAEWYVRDHSYLRLVETINQIALLLITMHRERGANKIISEKVIKHSKLISVKHLFQENLNIDLKSQTSWQEYQEISLSLGLNISMKKTDAYYKKEWNKMQIFQVIFDQYILPNLRGNIWHVCEFPPFVRGMASLNKDGWAERIECYIDGVEVSNGYQELSSPEELKEAWEYNNKIRKMRNQQEHSVDELLMEVIPNMKGVSGISLGIERVLIALGMAKEMRDFRWPNGN